MQSQQQIGIPGQQTPQQQLMDQQSMVLKMNDVQTNLTSVGKFSINFKLFSPIPNEIFKYLPG